MKLILVSQRVDVLPDRNEIRDSLDQRLIHFVGAAGGDALPVPNTLSDKLPAWLDMLDPAAILLSGGNDIGEQPERDFTEKTLLFHARRKRLPVLGICRGMQMMAYLAGSRLLPVEGHIRKRHKIQGEISGTVNSYHAHGVLECPEDYCVLARSDDGVIEAIRHLTLPWEGWMWHPERETTLAESDLQRWRALLNQAR